MDDFEKKLTELREQYLNLNRSLLDFNDNEHRCYIHGYESGMDKGIEIVLKLITQENENR